MAHGQWVPGAQRGRRGDVFAARYIPSLDRIAPFSVASSSGMVSPQDPPELRGSYGRALDGEDLASRDPVVVRRWVRLYDSLLGALEHELALGAFGLRSREAIDAEIERVTAKLRYWLHVSQELNREQALAKSARTKPA